MEVGVGLARNGWQRGTSYRVRLTGDLEDELGRRFGRTDTLEWRVPEAPAAGPIPPVLFDRIAATRYESWEAAKDDLGGRFPGGQTALFQGLWTDPVTGVSYARARWYDARNAAWLSEDPMADTDSPNLYAFVGWQPNMATDPLGLCGLWDIATNEDKCGEYFVEGLKENFLTKEMLSTAISFIPGVGDVKDAQEAITGVDLITGRELSWMERGITVAAAVIPMVGGSALRHALGNAGEKAAREGVEALEEGAEQAMKRGADVAEEGAEHAAREGAEHAAREGAERAAREGAEALDDISPPHQAKNLDEATAPPCPVAVNCFAAGTLVSTSEGLLPIEQVQTGDQVYAYDDATGEEHLAEVLALHHRDVEATWVLEVGGEKIETTDEHPFYVVGHGWTEAKGLHAGDLLVAEGGDRLLLDKIERIEGNARVYNFEVRDLHSYFVGTVGVVVHNCVKSGDVVPYRPSNTPLENHHGVLDVWASHNVPGYVSRAADNPTVAMTKLQHDATKAVFRDWLTENFGKPVGAVVDWTKITPRQVRDLSERMFDAANISRAARDEYYRAFNRYIYR